MSQPNNQIAVVVIASILCACESRGAEIAEPAAEPTAATEAPEEEDKVAEAEAVPVWPDGFLLVSEQEWIPVLDEAGESLVRARAAYVSGKKDEAAQELKTAAKGMKDAAASRDDADKQRVDEAAKQLDALATQVSGGEVVKQVDFDGALTSAYDADAVVTYLYLEEEALLPTFEKPSVHFSRALELLSKPDNEAAAEEILRGASYFRLATFSARSDDKEILDVQVARLQKAAEKAEAGTLEPGELRATLAKVDAAYAASYLHQAEAAFKAEEHASTGRALHEAFARIKARIGWLDDEAKEGAKSVADETEALAKDVAKGAKVPAKKLKSLFKRAYEQLESDDAPSAPKQGS